MHNHNRAHNADSWDSRLWQPGSTWGPRDATGFVVRGASRVAELMKKFPCRVCGQLGHWKRECPQRNSQNNSLAQFSRPAQANSSGARALDQLFGNGGGTPSTGVGVGTANVAATGSPVGPSGNGSGVPPVSNGGAAQPATGYASWALNFMTGGTEASSSTSEASPILERLAGWLKGTESSEGEKVTVNRDEASKLSVHLGPGEVIVDTRCTFSCAGRVWILKYLEAAREILGPHFRAEIINHRMGYSFGNNSREISKQRHRIPVSFAPGKGIGFLEIAELKDGPALLSNKSLKKLGLLLDTQKDKSYSRTLDCEIPLRVSKQGHYLLDLLGAGRETTEAADWNLRARAVEAPAGEEEERGVAHVGMRPPELRPERVRGVTVWDGATASVNWETVRERRVMFVRKMPRVAEMVRSGSVVPETRRVPT